MSERSLDAGRTIPVESLPNVCDFSCRPGYVVDRRARTAAGRADEAITAFTWRLEMPRKSMAVIASLVTVFWGTLASAGVTPTPFRTGLFGIAPGQAVRVSVLNAGNDGGIVIPCMNPDLGGFVVRISGPAGRILFESRHKTPLQGVGTFTDFVPTLEDGITGPGGAVVRARRMQMSAEVAIELTPPQKTVDVRTTPWPRHARRLLRNVHLTLEIYDVATGRTAFTMPFSAVMFNPQPEPPEPVAVP